MVVVLGVLTLVSSGMDVCRVFGGKWVPWWWTRCVAVDGVGIGVGIDICGADARAKSLGTRAGRTAYGVSATVCFGASSVMFADMFLPKFVPHDLIRQARKATRQYRATVTLG